MPRVRALALCRRRLRAEGGDSAAGIASFRLELVMSNEMIKDGSQSHQDYFDHWFPPPVWCVSSLFRLRGVLGK